MLSFYELILFGIVACYCILNTYKKYGIKNAIMLTVSGITIACLSPFFAQYITKHLDEKALIIALILLVGFFTGLFFWKNDKNEN